MFPTQIYTNFVLVAPTNVEALSSPQFSGTCINRFTQGYIATVFTCRLELESIAKITFFLRGNTKTNSARLPRSLARNVYALFSLKNNDYIRKSPPPRPL